MGMEVYKMSTCPWYPNCSSGDHCCYARQTNERISSESEDILQREYWDTYVFTQRPAHFRHGISGIVVESIKFVFHFSGLANIPISNKLEDLYYARCAFAKIYFIFCSSSIIAFCVFIIKPLCFSDLRAPLYLFLYMANVVPTGSIALI